MAVGSSSIIQDQIQRHRWIAEIQLEMVVMGRWQLTQEAGTPNFAMYELKTSGFDSRGVHLIGWLSVIFGLNTKFFTKLTTQLNEGQ